MADITEDDTVPPVEAVVEDTVLSEGVEEGKGETSTREESEPEAVQPAEQEEGKAKDDSNEVVPVPSISGSDVKQLLVGSLLLKAKKGTKVFLRQYNISTDLVRLSWNSKRKPLTKSQIPLSQIQKVLSGRSTDSFKLHQLEHDDNCCFSIIYTEDSNTKTLDLVATTPHEANLWVNGLLTLTLSGVPESTSQVRQRWLRGLFDDSDENGDGELSLREVVNMMKKLNVGVSTKIIRKMFKEADSDGNSDQKLSFEEFTALFHNLANRPELKNIFALYASSDNGSYMTVEDLIAFLVNAQNITDVTHEQCQSIIERFEPSEEGKSKLLLSLDGFTQYMLSSDNDIFKREHRNIYQDMTHTLSHYFIASSHNTYLLEDQLSGPSSVDAYIKALNKGCRCVELDCWDGDNDEPIIYHGHTLTSKILFKDVILAIKEHSFNVSPYPVILSIENHCGVKQQTVMAEHMITIFGDMLHKLPRDEGKGELPSPEDLKYKILIKAKKLAAEHEDVSDGEGDVTDEDEAAEIDPEDIKKAQASSTDPPSTEEPQVHKVVESRKKSFRKGQTSTGTAAKPSAKRKLSSKLSKCVNYVQSVHFKGFDRINDIPFFHMSSFGESSAVKSSEKMAGHFLEYNKKHLSRIYPSGKRVDSSNYEPINMWNAGCQIVALNYQSSGKPMDWNLGKFQQNGGVGYILKPEIMREDFACFNHMDKAGPSGISPKIVTISIISGQQLPKPEGGSTTGEVIDPYVQVQFAGIPRDCAHFKTKVIDDNGFAPVWNETFQHTVTFTELALVRFLVMDYDLLSKDDFIGQFTLPLDSIATGYRHIHLRNKEWEVIDKATLFVHITIEDLIAPPPRSKEKLRSVITKKSRQYCLMKPCLVPVIDTPLKLLNPTIKTGTDITEDTVFAIILFKDACCKSTVAGSLEAMFQQAKVLNITLSLLKSVSAGGNTVYHVESTGSVPPSLKRMMQTFDSLNSHILTLCNVSPSVISELESTLEKVLQQKEEFYKGLTSLTQQKAEEAKNAYSYNIRTLRNLLSNLNGTVSNANEIVTQIPLVSEKFSIQINESLQQQTTSEEKPQESSLAGNAEEQDSKEDNATATATATATAVEEDEATKR